ncbi:Maf family protein [Litorihabitans aurantiacus]|uniref:Maf family protein n=1 Tax=Litorihabitans aurantiacus TaxID=1930061 RepID=UPI0032AEF863
MAAPTPGSTPDRRRRSRDRTHVRLVLASASPARLALLTAAGIVPQVVVSDVDEEAVLAAERRRSITDLTVPEQVAVLARAKAEAVARELPPTDAHDLPGWCSAATRCSRSTARRTGSRTRPTAPPARGARCAAAPVSCTPATTSS